MRVSRALCVHTSRDSQKASANRAPKAINTLVVLSIGLQDGNTGPCHEWMGLGYAGGTRKGADVSYARHVPKFLQGHMHLLGRKEPGPDEAMAVEAPEEVQNHDLEADDEQAGPALDVLAKHMHK